MAKLTIGDWLEAYILIGLERLEKFPFIAAIADAFVTKPHHDCRLCPQVGKEGHESYECGKMTAPLPPESTPSLWAFATLQYLIHRLSGDLFFPFGVGSSWYGQASINFADMYNFKVVAVHGADHSILEIEAGDDFNGTIYSEMRANWGVPGRTILQHAGLSPQPNDRVVPGGGSLLEGKSIGRVYKVEMNRHSVPKRALVYTDQDFENIMVDNREDQTDPFIPTVTFIRQAGDMESWTPVVWPSEMKCQPRLLTIPVLDNEDFPEDGRVTLKRFDESNGRCARPESDPEKPKTFQVWKIQKTPEPTEEVPEPEPAEWEDITGLCVGRLKMYSYDSTGEKPGMGPNGADGRGAYKTVLCLGEKNWDDAEDFEPLYDENTVAFKVSYYPEVTDDFTGENYCVPCARRCVHAIRDMSNSFYDMDDGEAHLPNGEEYYCRMRRTYEIREVYTGPNVGRWEMVWHKPAKPEMFTADCYLHGVCPMFSPMEKGGIGERPFTLDGGDANQILKEMTNGQDIALVQFYPGYPFYYLQRVARPTIHSLTTAVPTSNPTEWSPNITFLQSGPSIKGSFETKEETDEESPDYGTTLNPLIGGAWDGRTVFNSLAFPAMPPPGIFPTLIPDWVSGKMDAFRRAYDDTTDKYKAQRYYEDDTSVRSGRIVQDGTAQGFGRGVSQAVRTIGADERFLLEAIDLRADQAGQEQDRNEATFTWYATDQAGPNGFQYRIKIVFKNLLPAGGTPKGLIKECKIMKVDTAGGKVVLHLENQSRSWARLKNVGMGNSFNEVFTFIAGGGIVRPPDPLQILSSETEGNSFGGVTDWVAIGDSAVIDFEATGFADFKDCHWAVMNATAYNGDKAADFGSGGTQIVSDKGLRNGYYQVPEDHFLLPNGENGRAVGAEVTTIEDYTDSDTTFTFATTPPFRYYQFLKVEDSDEIMQVLSVDYSNKQIYVSRGFGGHTTPEAIPTGKKLTLIQVYSETEHKEIELKKSETRPTLAAGECWYDDQAGRFYWSEADKEKYFDVAYYIEDGTENINPDKCYLQQFHYVFVEYVDSEAFIGKAYFVTELTFERFMGTAPGGLPESKVYLEGSELAITATDPPEDDKYFLFYDAGVNGGNVILVFAGKHSGKNIRIGVANEAGQSNPFNFDVAAVPEFATGAGWGKKMDTVELYDEGGRLSAQAANLVGKTIKFHRHEMILAPDSTIENFNITKWKEDDYLTQGTANFLLINGLATLYAKKVILDNMNQLWLEEETAWEEGDPEIEKRVCVELS